MQPNYEEIVGRIDRDTEERVQELDAAYDLKRTALGQVRALGKYMKAADYLLREELTGRSPGNPQIALSLEGGQVTVTCGEATILRHGQPQVIRACFSISSPFFDDVTMWTEEDNAPVLEEVARRVVEIRARKRLTRPD